MIEGRRGIEVFYYFCANCGAVLEWRYNEAIDDFACYCPACEDWTDDVQRVWPNDSFDRRYGRLRSRGWAD